MGLKSRQMEDLRITFDQDVRSSSASLLFPRQPFFRTHNKNEIILEIKCRNEQPARLTKIVRRHGLKVVANSKFTQGIEMSRPDVVTPMWSQGYISTEQTTAASQSCPGDNAATGPKLS
ncbi:MAG: VTC domain-containing protein [Bacillota bacterium]|nr:VTC domain-containing protein [Bacillota bacterium]MDW7685039.1 VTC domain-containing protein [Bacillota bacterium]